MKKDYQVDIKKYKEVFDILGDGVSIQDRDYKILYQNDAHIGLVGQHIGKFCYEAYEKRNDICEGCPVAKTFKDGIFHKEQRSAPVGDDFIHVEITSSPIRDSEGNILAGVEIVRDITEKKKTELKLKESEEKFRRIAENISEVFWIVSPDWERVHYISPAYEKIWGKSCQSLYNNPKSWLDSIMVEDKPYIDGAIKTAALNNEGEVTFPEYRIKKPDGEIRWIQSRGFPIKNKRSVVDSVVGIASDITRQKQAETRLQDSSEILEKMFSSPHFMVVILDKDFNFIRVNRAYAEKSNQEPDFFVGKNHFDLYPNEENEVIFRNVVNTGEPFTVFSKPFEFPGQPERGITYWDWSLHLVKNQHGETDVLIFTLVEVTKRVKTEERLRQAYKMEAIGTLTGGVAHDFNNILSIILGYAEMAKDDAPPNSPLINDLDNVLKAGGRAKDLVKQILAFSRQGSVERFPLQLQSLVKEALKMLRSSIPTTIEIQNDIDSRCGVVLADQTQVHQILMNLCTNASQAMEESGGILKVELKSICIDQADQQLALNLEPGEYVKLVVSDTGPGIDPDVLVRIFDPYFTTKGVGKGTGMGLAIVHGIVTDYGGSITAESELAKGATFNVYFPVVSQKELSLEKNDQEIPRGKGRVLFVDDEELLTMMGKDMLERLGYTVTARQSSLKALATFKDSPEDFDVIVTDQTMPDLTGSDLARLMLEIRPDIPIILCTGYSNLIDEETAKVIGIKEFAMKPLTKGVLARLLHKVLNAP